MIVISRSSIVDPESRSGRHVRRSAQVPPVAVPHNSARAAASAGSVRTRAGCRIPASAAFPRYCSASRRRRRSAPARHRRNRARARAGAGARSAVSTSLPGGIANASTVSGMRPRMWCAVAISAVPISSWVSRRMPTLIPAPDETSAPARAWRGNARPDVRTDKPNDGGRRCSRCRS